MDNLTHGLLGVTLAMLRRRDAGPGTEQPLQPPSPTDRAVMWTAFLAAEMPDLDVFLGSGPVDEYLYHRGLTHSAAFAPVVALAAATLTKLVWRRARFGTLYLWGLFSVLIAHLTNDWMTGWGTRLFLPFSEARLALDWVPIVDPLYTLPLVAAVVTAVRRPAWRQRAAAVVLAWLLVYAVGYRGTSQWLVARKVQALYAGQPVAQVRIAPDLFNPVRWVYTVDLGDRFEQGRSYAWSAPMGTRTVVKPPAEDAVVRSVREAPELKPFFDQFAYVRIAYTTVPSGYEVRLSDVRYEFPGRSMGLIVLLGPEFNVLQVESRR